MSKYDDFKKHTWDHLAAYKENTLKITKKVQLKNKTYSHILPKEQIKFNFLPLIRNNIFVDNEDSIKLGYPTRNEISLQTYAHHLNSSQAMCINFFAPLIKENNHNILLKLLKKQNIPVSSKIEEASFEKVINCNEETNFDFYLQLENNIRIFFEIKYTENGFGGLSSSTKPEKYVDKWNNIYKPYMSNTLYCKQFKDVVATIDNYKEIEFYKYYQIYRNISYIENKQDYVVFLTMRANTSTKNKLKKVVTDRKLGGDNVKVIYWDGEKGEEGKKGLIDDILELVSSNAELKNHYEEFKSKYFIED